MATIQDQAVCIRNRKYSETSQIVTLFSRDHGKIDAIAKGSRRQQSKFNGGIDILTQGEVGFVQPRGDQALATLTEFNLENPFTLLRQYLLPLNCAQYMCELLNHFTEEFDPHEELFLVFIDALEGMKNDGLALPALVKFEISLLQEIGLAPVWDRCVSCNGTLNGPKLFFTSSLSGMVCRDCEPAIVEKILVYPQVRQLLQNSRLIFETSHDILFYTHELLSYHQREQMQRQPAVMTMVNQLLKKWKENYDPREK